MCLCLQESPARENVDDDAAEQPIEVKKQKKIEAAGDEDVDIGDEMPMNNEDVDIGDEMPMNNFPPVEIEKDKDVAGGHASSSSSSGSSGSDSSSSSGMKPLPCIVVETINYQLCTTGI